MEAKDKKYIEQEILRKYPGTIPDMDIDWDIGEIFFQAGYDQARDECIEEQRALEEQDGS